MMRIIGRMMEVIRPLWLGLLLVLTAGGCVVHARGAAVVSTPGLVAIGPGIWVVEDYPTAVFYSDGYYWRYSDGWYRSYDISDAWVRVDVSYVPVTVRSVERPTAYVYYKAPPGADRRGPPGRAKGRGWGHD